MARRYSRRYTGRGVTMPSRYSRYACLHKHMRLHITDYKYCQIIPTKRGRRALLTINSAELEMTVNILIQIDKLVQLIESPVFTC